MLAGWMMGVLLLNAMMSPAYYKKEILESEIMAIARVINVKTLSVGEHSTLKEATFRLEYVLKPEKWRWKQNAPRVVTGCFESVEHGQQPSLGGTVYFYPYAGERVFVTISENDGPITSLTPLTLELEQIIRNNPARLRFGISRVNISDQP
jgi:hypothetical protein